MNTKKILIPIALLFGGAVMVGCTNKEETQVEQVATIKQDLVMDDVVVQLKESGVLLQQSIETPVKDHWILESVKDVIEDGIISQAMINVRLQDVILVKTSDMDAVEKAILEYKENSLRSFGDGYGGEDNITAVAESKLVKKDGYVYFIATPNASEVEAKLLEIIQ